jgi:hypothetical protein
MMDEILYGGGQSIPVGDPDSRPDESNVVSDMFFVADGSLIVAEYDMIVTRPVQLEGMTEPGVFFVTTFKGRHNKQKGLAAMTTIMEPRVAKAMLGNMRTLYTRVPLEFRNE